MARRWKKRLSQLALLPYRSYAISLFEIRLVWYSRELRLYDFYFYFSTKPVNYYMAVNQ